ncbi:Na(+)/H(+) exchange regulatory cofactor NHE-RF2 [Pimephales promelas]|uniref:Na(+)/H(+) exchange regulatory cofactor NHE-RF2 n=1 Tax=Pimephales promelas TaxID=90988 RepID=UPI0019556475|nr:Na(+)/H(+) exchange regulatory cofactor NHE-RF2 [Pimephales promelas]KAG1955984.1 Na(+)/H(+) exchange regulatory cofactor NHE-RF1 [Pimephales promelas]
MANTLEREILERELRPRLCYLTKGDRGYGFHLHGERNSGAQFIRKIEPGSPSDLSGLRSGDRVVEVNGVNVEEETHHQVVERILEVEHRTRLLVVDRVTDEFLKFHGLPCTEERAIEMGSLSARSSAASSPRASPRDPATPIYSRHSSEGIFINKSPSSPGRVMNGSPLYRACARLASPREPKTEPFTELTVESSTTPEPDPVCDLITDLSTSQTSTQEEALSEVDAVTKDLRPRLCHMTLGEQGYGFNLHCKKSHPGQHIRSVDPDSPAERAGLRPRDRLIEVNGCSIEGLRHAEVVALVKAGGTETRLLVVDPDTDELFSRLGIVPTSTHLKEDCVDGPIMEGTESPVSDNPGISPPIVNITLTDPPITDGSPRHQSHRSSSSRSTLSETSAELSSFDNSNRLTDSDHQSSDDARKPNRDAKSDPFWQSGLQLSLTAAEAKQKARAKRANKRAPPMDWSKKQEIFSNF